MNTYPINSVVRCSTAFANLAGAAADPTVTTFAFRTPAGVVTTYTYGTDAQLVKDSTGNFHVDLTASAAGVWDWEFRGTGAVTAQTPIGQFEVLAGIGGAPVAYATVADFTGTYEIPPTGRDARIQATLEEASAMLDAAIGWDFYRHPVTGTEVRYLDGEGTDKLCVHAGIVSLTTVEVRWGVTGAWETVASAEFSLEPRVLLAGETYAHIELTGAGPHVVWPDGSLTVRLTGVFGYATVPTTIRRATVALARQVYRSDATNPGGMIGPDELAGGVYPRGWPDEAYRAVDHFRRLHWCHV